MKRLLSLIFILFCSAAVAQTPEQQREFDAINWTTLAQSGEGFVCRQTQCRLFNSDQHISVIEVSPLRFSLAVAQPKDRTKTSRVAKRNNALAAVNGGYFKTKTYKSVPEGFLKINNTIYSEAPGGGGAAMGITPSGEVGFCSWDSSSENMAWQQNYSDVINAGPLLVRDGNLLLPEAPEQRHPRTIAGTKPDGTVVLVVIDGRDTKMDGMALWETGVLARLLGLDNCMNLDGGGSSTMWLRSKGVVNKVSDYAWFFRSQRQVANCVLVKYN